MPKPMTSKERMLAALNREKPDRLPATVHQWQAYHLNHYLGGITPLEAFRKFGLDAAISVFDGLSPPSTPHWRIEEKEIGRKNGNRLVKQTITTPEKVLTQVEEVSEQTSWYVEYLIKDPEDIFILKKYMPVPKLNQDLVRKEYKELGQDGILRGFVTGYQGGPWQNACGIAGTERMIYATFDNPGWVHEFLRILTDKKLQYIEESLKGAPFDLIETGGGAASSNVISPKLFKEFCLPYDREIHDALHALGHKVVYHTCGGMMAILELIVANGCDASETLAPKEVGGDAVPEEIKARIGDKVALIGGVDQFNILTDGTPEMIRQHVHDLFAKLGPGGGYIMCPSDHFFDTLPEKLHIYAEAARECVYE
ncbi:MAG: uroporphyrinogen decarboxylase family protein [Anaerolineae bacterium]